MIPTLFAMSTSGPAVSPNPGASHKFKYPDSCCPITSFRLTLTGLMYLVSDWFKQLLITPFNDGLLGGNDIASIWWSIKAFSATLTLFSPILQPAKNWMVVDLPDPVSPIKRTISWSEIKLLPSAAFSTSLTISLMFNCRISLSSFLKELIKSKISTFVSISKRIWLTDWELSSCFFIWNFSSLLRSSISSFFDK